MKSIDDFEPPVKYVEVGAMPVQAPREKTPEPVVKKTDNNEKELNDLRNRVAKQQDEISRLLLLIDELRKRLEQVQVAAKKAGPTMMSAVGGIMSSAGLKELLEKGCGPKLKGV